MRDLVKVIDRMKEVIPAGEGTLIACLNSCRSSAAFSAPELMYLRWRAVADCLEDRLGHLEEQEIMQEGTWTRQITDIWMDKERV